MDNCDVPAETLALAYFSMEVGIDPAMPTYSGGLGVLAGDTMHAAADLCLAAVGITLLHRKGYLLQHLDKAGKQTETGEDWAPESFMKLLPNRVMVIVEGRQVQVQIWRYSVRGESGHIVPIYFLDTNVPENTPWDQKLTDNLYGGDDRYRLCQQVLLGLGGISVLRSLGYQKVHAYHMNEGHSALIVLALLEEQTLGRNLNACSSVDIEAVRQQCIFTTHTPLLAGHEHFRLDLVRRVLGEELTGFLDANGLCQNGVLSMTNLALKLSLYVNGVSMRHEEVSRSMFTGHSINSVTNGVHAITWTSAPFTSIYDHYIPPWRHDNLYLRYAIKVPLAELQQAHAVAKKEMLAEVERRSGVCLDPKVMTIGFARRATEYKRADLLFHDLNRLKKIAKEAGPVQILYGGKAHPRDEGGKWLIRRIFEAANALKGIIPVIYLEGYDMRLAKYLTSGVDLWLNTPLKPLEASGTSGMKCALNGIPSLSILDGWWIEGHIEGVTGWSIDDKSQTESCIECEVASLYDKLEYTILPMFYRQPETYANVMRSAIALNGSYFNAQRMINQYLQNAYLTPRNSWHSSQLTRYRSLAKDVLTSITHLTDQKR